MCRVIQGLPISKQKRFESGKKVFYSERRARLTVKEIPRERI